MKSLTSSRADILTCCSGQSSTYVGVDSQCTRGALFCLQHNPHINQQSHLLHQMIPVRTFKHNLYDAKFKMNEKVEGLVKEYQIFMNKLIEQLQELQVRKKIELSMLWLRELADDEQEYQNMRKIYRMDFEGLRCKDIARVYFKIHKGQKTHNNLQQNLSLISRKHRSTKQQSSQILSIYHLPIQRLQCYQGMIEILNRLNDSQTAYCFIRDKVAQIQGVIQSGEILKKALPTQILIEGSLKEVLLQTPHFSNIEVSYNKLRVRQQTKRVADSYYQGEQQQTVKAPSTCFYSTFSKYPISVNTKYHIQINTQYGNVMVGVCRQSMLKKLFAKHIEGEEDQSTYRQENINESWTFLSFSELELVTVYNMHYEELSLVYNCSNGCVYREGAFTMQHSTAQVKEHNQFKLSMNVVHNQLIIIYGKVVVARCDVPLGKNEDDGLLLHILTRTEGDTVSVQREIRRVVKDQQGEDIQIQDQ